MIVEKVIRNLKNSSGEEKKLDRVYLEWYELGKHTFRKTTESGKEIGIRISEHLTDGDVLYEDAQELICVALKPTKLTRVAVTTMKEMGRLCFELGNRHLSLAIEDHSVSVIYDEPTFEYLQKLGFKPQICEGKFEHVTVCHGHRHEPDTHYQEHTVHIQEGNGHA